ncbi:thiamine pyrophosphate-binding protein [Pectobacterium colocasium]|uniref:thiamine pyrophosphate-binding protein n=1 Tax=Pectobacterium colocasium TaxID=2878098 RepID=UPI001CD277FE|nr:thiamine pyrophosphate-binding protein [Pectobacterium colocasium]
MKMRVADFIVQHLRNIGVDTVFLLNGGGMMHMVDALARCEGIRYVCSHHEQASAIAADAYARLSGKLGVCYATAGPGATNILTGVVGAWQDSSPALFITGQSKSTQTIALSGIKGLRQFGTFEVNTVPIMESVTKYSHMLTDASTIKYHLEKAIHEATSGRPGPVLLDIPLDIQGALIDPETLQGFVDEEPAAALAPTENEIQQIITAVSGAKRPVILAGVGVRVANASEAFRKLIEEWQIPVVTTQLGKDAMYYEHPLFVGHSGPKGDRAGNFAVQTADVILSLGTSLHGQTTGWENKLFAPTATKIQIDLDDAVLEREQINVNLKVRAGVAEFIECIKPFITPHASEKWRACCHSWKTRYPVHAEPHQHEEDGANFYDFAEILSQLLPDNACVVSDAGSAFYVAGQAIRLKDGQRFISSGSLGAMGYALPAANGCSLFDRNRPIVCVTGDGSLMTNVHELATMRMEQRNVKLFVINNSGYVSMRNTHREFFQGLIVGADYESGVFIPAMESLAKSYELPYLCCKTDEEIRHTIREALEMDGPVLVEVITMKNQRIIPTVASKRLPDGRMVSTPIHEMQPALPDDVIAKEMSAAISED